MLRLGLENLDSSLSVQCKLKYISSAETFVDIRCISLLCQLKYLSLAPCPYNVFLSWPLAETATKKISMLQESQ